MIAGREARRADRRAGGPGAKMGRVALVGAGPGDPSLLTLRAAELLRVADAVAHDELVSEAVLAMVPARAALFSVGRRAGQGTLAHRLHPEVLSRARRGELVVRLKAGDPLVFGRGGEEAAELAEEGIPFEIVPGITAALGAAAYAGVPLTHRDHSARIVVASGHRGDGGLPPRAVVGEATLVLYMASKDLAANLGAAVASGWEPSTPAALIASATNPDERIVRGTLATLADDAARAGVPLPRQASLLVVGDVVRALVDWRGRLLLRDRRVVVARLRDGHSEAARTLRDAGATVSELPLAGPARWPAGVDVVVLPSASAATALYMCAPSWIRHAPAVALGEGASAAAVRAGAFDVWTVSDDDLGAIAPATAALLATCDGRARDRPARADAAGDVKEASP